MSILFIDNINFHSKNFPELFRTINMCNYTYRYHFSKYDKLKTAYGNYKSHARQLSKYKNKINKQPLSYWLDNDIDGLNLFSFAKAEVLLRAISKKAWYDQCTDNNDTIVFQKLLKSDADLLVDGLAAACLWLEYWEEFFKKNHAKYKYLFIFSNSYIYTKTAALMADRFDITVYVMEHFFTGKDYYIEQTTQSIQSANPLSLPVPEDTKINEIQVNRMFVDSQNRNVKKENMAYRSFFDNKSKTVLLVCQVSNDFSLIESHADSLGSIYFYKSAIKEILEKTTYNILIKTHPYEARKLALKDKITYNELTNYRINLPDHLVSRVEITDRYPFEAMLKQSDCVLSLCSQAGLEALWHKKPVLIHKNAFYSSKGFTKEFSSVDDIVNILNTSERLALSDTENKAFYAFMTHAKNLLYSAQTAELKFLPLFENAAVGKRGENLLGKASFLNSFYVYRKISYILPTRKIKKLLKDPRGFFRDAHLNKKKNAS
ncbi:MAG: hypothetical protein CMH30_09530 [Micavibrio sp.]|nr:hypothetical protein [Micavibrio sp.]